MTDTQLILEEMRLLRQEFTNFSRDCTDRLSAVETENHSLIGNGQPGRVGVLETSMSSLSKKVSYMFGCAVGAGAVIGGVWGIVVTAIKH